MGYRLRIKHIMNGLLVEESLNLKSGVFPPSTIYQFHAMFLRGKNSYAAFKKWVSKPHLLRIYIYIYIYIYI